MLTLSRQWDPWKELERVQHELNRVFTDGRRTYAGVRGEYPVVNLWQTADAVMFVAEVPGVAPEDLELTVTGDVLTLRGKRAAETLPEETSYQRNERRQGAFSRSVSLPFAVDSDRTEAHYERGVLTVKLYRPEDQKPQKVQIRLG